MSTKTPVVVRAPEVNATSTPDDRCAGLIRWISSQLLSCSEDELRVLARMLERFVPAREDYGPLDVRRDRRDFGQEAADELADCLFYLCARDVAAQHAKTDAIEAAE
jgi:hypothetical protein